MNRAVATALEVLRAMSLIPTPKHYFSIINNGRSADNVLQAGPILPYRVREQ